MNHGYVVTGHTALIVLVYTMYVAFSFSCRYHKDGQSLLVLLPSEESEMIKVLFVAMLVLIAIDHMTIFKSPWMD